MNTTGLGPMQVTGIEAPPALSDEVVGMLRAMADPTLAQQLIDHQSAWEKAYADNAKQLARAKKIADLDKAKATAEAKAHEAGRTLEEARAETDRILKAARVDADNIVHEAEPHRLFGRVAPV